MLCILWGMKRKEAAKSTRNVRAPRTGERGSTELWELSSFAQANRAEVQKGVPRGPRGPLRHPSRLRFSPMTGSTTSR